MARDDMRRMGLALVALAVIAACGDSDPTGPGGESDWIPMAVGNQWIYAVEGMWVDSSTDADTTFITGTSSLTVTGQATHDEGFDLFALQDVSNAVMTSSDTVIVVSDTSLSYIRSTSSAVYMYDDTLGSFSSLELKLPLFMGSTWNPYPGATEVTRSVVSLTQTITAPAGTFTGCAQVTDIDLSSPDWQSSRFYAPGVGQVQVTSTYGDSSWYGVDNSHLASYTVN
jgi:hypothetical protein